MSGSEKPLLVLPRRKSKKLELAHCPPPPPPPNANWILPVNADGVVGPDHRPCTVLTVGGVSLWCVILRPPDLALLVRSGPVIRDLGGSVRIWGDNGPVLISYFYDGAAPAKVFQNRSQSGFYMDIYLHVFRNPVHGALDSANAETLGRHC